MKKKIIMIMTSVCLVMMIISTLMVQRAYADGSGSGSLDQVKCYCTRDISVVPNGCYANGDSNHLCAQSAPGGNILCDEYSSNCKKIF